MLRVDGLDHCEYFSCNFPFVEISLCTVAYNRQIIPAEILFVPAERVGSNPSKLFELGKESKQVVCQ